MPIYVLDSNFFIQAHRANYPLDVVLSFWEKTKQLADEGKIISIDKVKNELFDKNDALEEWCKSSLPDDFFKSSNDVLASTYPEIIGWANSRRDHYLEKAVTEFSDVDEADAFLIAYALADSENRILVTQETSEPTRKNKIKIPDVCNEFGVKSIDTIEMLRTLKETF